MYVVIPVLPSCMEELLICGSKSMYEIFTFSEAISKADLPAESVFSFPFTPIKLKIVKNSAPLKIILLYATFVYILLKLICVYLIKPNV